MRVWCAVYDKGGTPFTTAPTATGSSVTYTIPAGWWVHCYWLNTAELEAVDMYFAEMHPWVCPLDTVKAVDVLRESCGTATGPVVFSVTDAAGTVWDARAGEGRDSVRLDELLAGSLSMTVQFPEGVEDAFVACQAVDARGAPVGELAEVPLEVGGESAMWQLDLAEGSGEGGGAVCHVFLFARR
jgi:hypothetical protein